MILWRPTCGSWGRSFPPPASRHSQCSYCKNLVRPTEDDVNFCLWFGRRRFQSDLSTFTCMLVLPGRLASRWIPSPWGASRKRRCCEYSSNGMAWSSGVHSEICGPLQLLSQEEVWLCKHLSNIENAVKSPLYITNLLRLNRKWITYNRGSNDNFKFSWINYFPTCHNGFRKRLLSIDVRFPSINAKQAIGNIVNMIRKQD